jgi:hypothetical protein
MSRFFDVDSRARTGDPSTSFEAVSGIMYKMTAIRITVLQHFAKYHMLTDLDLQRLCDNHLATYRTRRSELTQMGYIRDSGQFKIQNGTKRTVWVITARGLAMAKVYKNEYP